MKYPCCFMLMLLPCEHTSKEWESASGYSTPKLMLTSITFSFYTAKRRTNLNWDFLSLKNKTKYPNLLWGFDLCFWVLIVWGFFAIKVSEFNVEIFCCDMIRIKETNTTKGNVKRLSSGWVNSKGDLPSGKGKISLWSTVREWEKR